MPDTPAAPAETAAAEARDAALMAMSKADWIMLAKLAWMNNPNVSLATQIAEDLGVNHRNCQYWLSPKNPTAPPIGIRRAAYELAARKFNRYADLLDRLDGLETPAPPADPA